MCKHQWLFGLEVQCSTLVLTFNNIFFKWAFVPGWTINEFPAFANTRSLYATMNKNIKIIIDLITFLAIAYVAFEFYQMGSLVRGKPESQEQYDHLSKRISITTIYNGKKLDSLIANFLNKHTNYFIPDSIRQSNESDLSEYNGYPLSFFNQIYFGNIPTERYF